MKKLFQYSLLISTVYLGLVLTLSLFLTSERFHLFLLNSFFQQHIEIEIKNADWHPINPSIEIGNLKVGDENELLAADEVLIQFSLLNLFSGNFIKTMNLHNARAYYLLEPKEHGLNLEIFNSLKFIENFSLQGLKVFTTDSEKLLEIDFFSSFNDAGHLIRTRLKDKQSNFISLDIRPSTIAGSKLQEGFLSAQSFSIDNSLIKRLCKKCNFDVSLDSQVAFNFSEGKLLNLTGNLQLNSEEKFFGIESISTSFTLKDSENLVLQLSSRFNDDESLWLPDFFIFAKDRKFVIPELNLEETHFLNSFANSFMPVISLSGKLINTNINFKPESDLISSNFINLGIKNKNIDISGFRGRFSYSNTKKGSLIIDSPLINVNSNLLESNLNLDNLVAEIDFDIKKGKLIISPSDFITNYLGEKLTGRVKLQPNFLQGQGNLTLSIDSRLISSSAAFDLFPEISYLSGTRAVLKEMITCGNFKNLKLIYRGPVDGNWNLKTSSFSMNSLAEGLCLEFNGYLIDEVKSSIFVNNLLMRGEIKEGKFLQSKVFSKFETYYDQGYRLNLKGKLEGPFWTISKLTIPGIDNIFSKVGSHETKFEFDTPLQKNISLLGKGSRLKVNSEAKRGALNLSNFGYDFRNISFETDYDSSVGIKNGFISFTLNSNPMRLDLSPIQDSLGITSFTATEKLRLNDFIPKHFKNNISGYTDTFIELNIPSFIRGQNLKTPEVKVSSYLKGITLNFGEPFEKFSDEESFLQVFFYPYFSLGASRLQFKYGDLLRGKLNLKTNSIEGFLIAGKDKQSISIEEGKISLIGNFQKFDSKLLQTVSSVGSEQTFNFEIKKLTVNEILFSNYVFFDNTISSKNTEKYFEIGITNKEIGGKIALPYNDKNPLLIDLDYLRLNTSGASAKSSFLDFYNDLDISLKFNTDSFFLNSKNYGNWSFYLSKGPSSMTFDDLEVVYGKWGLTKNKSGISRLTIEKKGMQWETNLDTQIFSGSPEKAFKQIGIEPNFEMDTFSMETALNGQFLPWELSYKALLGEVDLSIEGLVIKNNEDLQTQNNLLRLINIFNITDSFEKVTNLNFKKLYKSGFSADSVRGSMIISKDEIKINQPLKFKSGSSEFSWTGKISKNQDKSLNELNLEVVMTLPLREYLPAYALLLGGPLTAGIVYIAGKAFERNLDQLSSGAWSVTGTLENPKTSFSGWFEDVKK